MLGYMFTAHAQKQQALHCIGYYLHYKSETI